MSGHAPQHTAATDTGTPRTNSLLHVLTAGSIEERLRSMAGRGGKNSSGGGGGSLYAVLGVATDCSDAELRSAYRKLAMKWHPDKCGGAGSSGDAKAAKARFQKIQGAYAVLSDPNKRILYDVGAYDSDGGDDDDDGAGEILGDILEAMNKTSPHDNGEGESLEELQMQFEELFLRPATSAAARPSSSSSSSSSSSAFSSRQDGAGKSSSSSSKMKGGRK